MAKTCSMLYLFLSTVSASEFLTIRQQDSGYCEITLMESNNVDNTIDATSSLSFQYQTPLVETTSTDIGSYYVVSYPSDDPNGAAHLWELNSNLTVQNEWIQPANGLSFFDLQYSTIQSKLFGIAVNGTYGRIISYLDTTGDEVTATYIAPCPYMWYVNASTFNHDLDIYYGLLNKFNNASAGQKVIVTNVTDGCDSPSTIFDYNVTLTGVLYYITYTSEGLYAMASSVDEGYASLGHLSFGTDDNLLFNHITTFDGLGKFSPIFTTTDQKVCSMVGNDEEIPQLGCYSLRTGEVTLNQYLDSGKGNAAAVAAFYSY
jgi:hypothetical protein